MKAPFNVLAGIFTLLFISVTLCIGVAWSLSNIESFGKQTFPMVSPTPFTPQLITTVDLHASPPTPTAKPQIIIPRKLDIVEGDNYVTPPGSCNSPLSYHIGEIDGRFSLSRNSIEMFAKQAADIWNTAISTPLFREDPYGEITINIVYDQRQELMDTLNGIQQQLSRDAATIGLVKTQFETLKANYEPNLQSTLEELVITINADVASYNNLVNEYNSTAKSLETLFDQKPYAGIYNTGSKVITIYLNRSQEEFTHTIAHEFGHAIGLGHNENINAIMYPNTNSSLTLSPEDLTAIKTRCSL